ncbi:hypothetical protein [Martelella endophytica]|uniref:hypothetical protein n=1 Tax=Martelella endophytica TaxID=1486262 RepID=UPI000A4F494B|nr:hypothetical protein [Martelella endophytica]
MSVTLKIAPITALAVSTLLIAGCTTYDQQRYTPPPAQQPQQPTSMVDGQWLDKNGIISNFYAGTFETRTSDTNQVLATGTYTEVGNNVVEIDLTSVLRQTRSRVNCAVVSNYLMNCTPSQGSQFSLYKPANAPIGFTLDNVPVASATPPSTAAQANPMGSAAPAAVGTFSSSQMGVTF